MDNTTIQKPYAGFAEPKANYFPLPNDIFDFFRLLQDIKGPWITSELKIILMLQKHAWHLPNGLTEQQIRQGVRRGRRPSDLGTGLDSRTAKKSLRLLIEVGAIRAEFGGSEETYKLNYREQDNCQANTSFDGFPPVTENFFKVPNCLVDIIYEIRSAATILATLYLIRHSWGYANPDGYWMEIEEFQSGRYRSTGRYDDGLGFDDKTLYKALIGGIHAGLIVWSDRHPNFKMRRIYNLRFSGMVCNPKTGEFLGQHTWESDDEHREWESSRYFCREIPHPVRKIANFKGEFAKPIRVIAVSRRKITYPNRKFALVCRKNAEKTERFVHKYTDKNLQKNMANTPPTPLQAFHSFESVVAEKFKKTENLLHAVNIQTKKANNTAIGKLSFTQICAWILNAWGEPSITNPVGFLFTRCRDGDLPQEQYLSMVTCPLADFIAEFDVTKLPHAIYDAIQPFREDEMGFQTREELITTRDTAAEDLWNSVKNHLQERITLTDFRTWVEPSRGFSWDENTLTIASVNAFAMEWIHKNLGAGIASALESAHPGSRVAFVVAPPA